MEMTFKPNIPHRIVIVPKDVEILTGLSKRSAQILLQQIRKELGKSKHHFVTIAEFCRHTGITENEVRDSLRAWE